MTARQRFEMLFRRMLANWPVADQEARDGKSKLFFKLFEQYGETRFAQGVDKAIKLHYSPFFPTVGEFSGFIPEPPARNDGWTHTAEEWRAIRAEQRTPEFRAAWSKFMRTLGVKEAPWPEDLQKTVRF